jgi:hypothetical protein
MATGFQKAQRFLTNPTIALTGPTGSGKTFSALRLASGISKAMGKPFAVIDTENGSASLYSRLFDFEVLNISPPFTTEKYIDAIQLAEKSGFCALVCDSITHAWAGEGGLLEQKAQLDARPGSNHWTNWNPIKAKDLKFKNCYLHSSIPFFIATMRSKMEYAQSEDGGKKKVQKVGMAPVQSDGIEYEFSVVLDVAMNHECEVSKDRTHLFDRKPIFTITEEVGEGFVKWRSEGSTRPTPEPVAAPPRPVVIPQGWDSLNLPSDNGGNMDRAADEAMYAGDEDLDEALGKPSPEVYEAGEYMITFDQFKGKTISQVPGPILIAYVGHLQKRAKEQGKQIDPNGQVGLLIKNAAIFMGVE